MASREFIYFIRAVEGGPVKIGYTSADPAARLLALQTGSPVPLCILGVIEGTQTEERELHRRFAALRQKGEWFDASPDLLAFIEEHTTQDYDPVGIQFPGRRNGTSSRGIKPFELIGTLERELAVLRAHRCPRCELNAPMSPDGWCDECTVCEVHLDEVNEDGECDACIDEMLEEATRLLPKEDPLHTEARRLILLPPELDEDYAAAQVST